jgi:hypothetical protein
MMRRDIELRIERHSLSLRTFIVREDFNGICRIKCATARSSQVLLLSHETPFPFNLFESIYSKRNCGFSSFCFLDSTSQNIGTIPNITDFLQLSRKHQQKLPSQRTNSMGFAPLLLAALPFFFRPPISLP